jgi:glucokinase
MTLDAGGTNFVFSAIMSGKTIVEPFTLPSEGSDLKKSLTNIIKGFHHVANQTQKPAAISFAFPGPADYPNGVIGDLVNLPAYKGGVALGAMLEEEFQMPVFINNDGDLFAYGEAIGGILPEINLKLENAGSSKRYRNLLGVTLGTGFGGGIVQDGKLYIGDNSMAAEVYAFRNKLFPKMCAEDGISIRAVISSYLKFSEQPENNEITPKDIFLIASGQKQGNKEAARKAFAEMGEILGDVLAQLATTLDCLIVIGGGLSGAAPFFMPSVLNEMNSFYQLPDGEKIPRLIQKTVDLDTEEGLKAIIHQKTIQLNVFGTNKTISYNPEAILGIGISRLGTSKATSLGAVAYALSALDSV